VSAAVTVTVQDAAVITIVEKLRDHGSWTGQTHVQKSLFFCQEMMRLPLGFDYILYKHGPYSSMVERSIHRLQADSALVFVPQRQPYRPRLVTAEGAELIRENEPSVLADYDGALDFAAAILGRKSIKELERVATALWFIVRRPSAGAHEVATLVHERKPHISLEQATAAFEEVLNHGRLARKRGLIGSPGPSGLSDGAPSRLPDDVDSLIIDAASATHRLDGDEFARWAHNKTVFISSEMSDLAAYRRALAEGLRDVGLRVLIFEDLGGLDDDPRRAYLDRVAKADFYVGIVADNYGTVLATGRSPTHEEYREARRLGKRISFWVARDDHARVAAASAFVTEVQDFYTTGGFTDAEDLCSRVHERLREMAADDEAPWIKLGQVCLRAARIVTKGSSLVVAAEVRDHDIARVLEELHTGGRGPAEPVSVATADRAGAAHNIALRARTEASPSAS
jgi:uncharacterized protein YwgA